MPNEQAVFKIEVSANIDQVLGVASKVALFLDAELAGVRLATAGVVKQDKTVILRQNRCQIAPHILVTTKAMCHNDGSGTGSQNIDIVKILQQSYTPRFYASPIDESTILALRKQIQKH